MRKARSAGLLLTALAAWAQPDRSVEITSEPSHHLVLENGYVRVFDVTVAPKATTLIHRHNVDYLFVTLGDSDVTSARVGEKPVRLTLKDGEVRFTPGKFAHAAINNSERPFHNITIELLQPSSNVKTCSESCGSLRISSDQWRLSSIDLPPAGKTENSIQGPALIVAVSPLDLTTQSGTESHSIQRSTGGLLWVPAGAMTVTNNAAAPARYVTLAFQAAK
jgi:quercetin dioxygenase-like cupin family protein